jgi:hypothetical protein
MANLEVVGDRARLALADFEIAYVCARPPTSQRKSNITLHRRYEGGNAPTGRPG